MPDVRVTASNAVKQLLTSILLQSGRTTKLSSGGLLGRIPAETEKRAAGCCSNLFGETALGPLGRSTDPGHGLDKSLLLGPNPRVPTAFRTASHFLAERMKALIFSA
jgi:hypothetical protein